MKQIPFSLSILFPFLTSSCMVGPDYIPPTVKMPTNWANTTKQQPDQSLCLQDIAWWNQFNDPDLNDLIKEAANTNLNLQSALEAIKQARGQVAAAHSALFPIVEGVASYTRRHSSQNGSSSISAPVAPTSTGFESGIANSVGGGGGFAPNNFQVGFQTTWEIDLFGGLRRAEEAATGTLQSTIEQGRATHLALIAQIAQTYLTMRNNQENLKSLTEQVDLWEKYLILKQDLLRSGLTDETDLNTAQISLNQAKSQIPTLQSSIKSNLHQLALLLSKEPTAFYERFKEPKRVFTPSLETIIGPGIPASLLQQRPDIRQAERTLASNTANIGVSVATLFPSISVIGNYGLISNKFSALFQDNSQAWSINPSMTVPLLDFGKFKAQIDQSEALQAQSLLAYKQLILSALGDVETSLVAVKQENSRSQILEKEAQVYDKNYKIMQDKQSSGLSTLLDVYSAKINWLVAQQAYLNSQTAQAINLVNLYKSLGGGWNHFETFQNQDRKSPLVLSSAVSYLLEK